MRVSTSEWFSGCIYTELYETEDIGAHQICFLFKTCWTISKRGRLKVEWYQKSRTNFEHFAPALLSKLGGEYAKCQDEKIKFHIRVNQSWYTFDGRPLRVC